jgi:hypothetical protein
LPVIEHTGGEVQIVAQGRRWRFAAAAAPLLNMLASGQPNDIKDFYSQGLDGPTLRAFIRELVTNGLVVVVV